MTSHEVAVIVLLLPMILLTSLAIRLMIGSDHKDRIERSDRIPVKVREYKGKKDRQ